MKKILFTLFIILFFPYVAFSATYIASDCSQSAVQAALNLASHGDSVVIPSGTSNWTSGVTCNQGIDFYGAGESGTTITATANFTMFNITTSDSGTFRMHAMTLNKGGGATSVIGIYIHGTAVDWRIDHMTFASLSSWSIQTDDYCYGLIDNCTFTGGQGHIYIGADGNTSWGRAVTLGDANAVYIEDCTFTAASTSTHCIDSNDGARWVLRYSDITNLSISAHGYCFQGNYGTVSIEVYENTFTNTGSIYRGIFPRGGTGVIYNNAFTGTWSRPIDLTTYRVGTNCANGGCCEANEGYPCLGQIGRGQSQTLAPFYIWGNTDGGVAEDGQANMVGTDCGSTFVDFVQANRDYYPDTSAVTAYGYSSYTYPHPLREKKVSMHGCSVTGGSFP